MCFGGAMTREQLIASYKKAHPTYREQADAIIKSLDKPHCEMQPRPRTSKKGKPFMQNYKVCEKQEKPQDKPAPQPEAVDIPTIELEPLRDISEAEIQRLTQSNDRGTLDELETVLKERFKTRLITNNSNGNKILITTKGIEKSIRPYNRPVCE